VPSLVAAVSRKLHAGVPYDIPLITPNSSPIVSLNAIEPRVNTGGYTIVLTFDQPVNAGTPSVTAGSATITSGTTAFSNNQMSFAFTTSTDNQTVTFKASSVAATDGTGTLGSVSVSFRLLQGDINGSGSISITDINMCKLYNGQAINYGNFRADINASGSFSITDINMVKLQNAKTNAGGAMTNTAPTIGTIAAMNINNDSASTPVGFAVNDAETDPNNLYVSATSDNATLIPNSSANIILAGTGTSRTISLSPAANQTGTCNVTVSVSDGILITSTTFGVTVTNGTVLYIASLTPENGGIGANGAVSTGSGGATLQMSGDQTYAILRFSYENLNGVVSGEHIHLGGPGVQGDIIFDIDTATPQTDMIGKYYKWTFVQSGNYSVQDQINAIAAGNTYLNVHTSPNFLGGEIRGQFLLVQGSQTFTPPAAPPSLPTGPATPTDAVRFLQQGTFGATISGVTALVNDPSGNALTAYSNWIDAQANTGTTPQTSTLSNFESLVNTNQDGAGNGASYAYQSTGANCMWSAFINGNDQLRQRVAYAYSQIFVISDVDDNLDGHPAGFNSYHDMLAADAFANFRTLLGDVTLHPMMGQYLSMRGNLGPSPSHPTYTPNENYGREILQLFSIGLNFLQPDGTLKLDGNGLPIPTYQQTTITNFAHVFTGWNNNGTAVVIPTLAANVSTNNNEVYISPMIVTAANHSTLQKNLLSYDPNDPTNYTTIASNTSQTTTTCNTELSTALDNVFNHPNVGPFIARRLIQRLVCDNPSPAYVYRVAQVFNNNGSSVRGDMKAVIKAILMDYEARSTAFLPNWSSAPGTAGVPGYGKVREPVIRCTQIIRAFHPQSKVQNNPPAGGVFAPFRLGITDGGSLSQTPYRAPTVFNFYEPDFADAGIIAGANLVSPEMEIETETTTIEQHNVIYNGIFNSKSYTTIGYGWPSGDVMINLNATDAAWNDPAINLGTLSEADLCATDAGVDTLIARYNLLLMANQMQAQNVVVNSTTYNMKNQISAQIKTMTKATADNQLGRARSCLRLVVSAPQFNVQR
jgi:uncharacterized protein (DUF1800 family)